MRRPTARFIVALLSILVIASALLYTLAAIGVHNWYAGQGGATSGALSLVGLAGSVRIARDRFGATYVSAESTHDTFFGQGYATAQDRFFQMDLLRSIAYGRLAERWGDDSEQSSIASDSFWRPLGLRTLAQGEYDRLDASTRAEVDAYSAGVNAFLDANKGNVSIEYSLVGTEPQHWSGVDTLALARLYALSLTDSYSKYAAARIYQAHPELLDLFLPPNTIAPRPLADSYPAKSGVPTTYAELLPTLPAGERALLTALGRANAQAAMGGAAQEMLQVQQLPEQLVGFGRRGGSNGFVVDGTRTKSGKPLLAGDPHLLVGLPSALYQVSLASSDGLHAEGASLPGLPGLVIGRTGSDSDGVAWTVTVAMTSDVDLRMVEVAADGVTYRTANGTAQLDVSRETLKTLGSDKTMDLTVQRVRDAGAGVPAVLLLGGLPNNQGGMQHVGVETAQPGSPRLAFQWTGLDPHASYAGILRLATAKDATQLRSALADLPFGLHVMYATSGGDIGYQMAGKLPIRDQTALFLPTALSDARYDWKGYVPSAQLPHVENPSAHYFVTANNQVASESALPITHLADTGYRAARLTSLVSQASALDAAGARAMQRDLTSSAAQSIAPNLLAAASRVGSAGKLDADATTATKLLAHWDGQLSSDSVAASVYEVTLALLTRDAASALGDAGTAWLAAAPQDDAARYALLDEQLAQPEETRVAPLSDHAVAHALGAAVRYLRATLGGDQHAWAWGQLHAVRVAHPFASSVAGSPLGFLLAPPFAVDAMPIGGDATTLALASLEGATATPQLHESSFAPVYMPAYRTITDFGLAPDEQATWLSPLGQSGHAGAAHYSDLATRWTSDQRIAVAWSDAARAAVDRDSAVLTLREKE